MPFLIRCQVRNKLFYTIFFIINNLTIYKIAKVGVSIVQKMILGGSAGELAFNQSREKPSFRLKAPCGFLPRSHYITVLLKL
jgi:hypothetical protein